MHKLFLCGLLLCLVSLFACNEPDTIGLDVLPGGDSVGVEFIDTFTVQTSYKTETDSFRVDQDFYEILGVSFFKNLIGRYDDPVFGIAEASLYAQFQPKAALDAANKTYDSIFLNLAYLSNYGDSIDNNTDQFYEVYEVTQDIYEDSAYYSFSTFTTSSKIGELQFKAVDVDDSLLVVNGSDSSKIAPRIRIKLDDAFGQKVFNGTSTIDGFKNNVKGLYIKPKDGTFGSIITINAGSLQSSLVLYYTDGNTSGLDSLPYYMYDDGGSIPRVNHFTHDYTGKFDFNNPDPEKGYVQSMLGIKTKINLPYLLSLKTIGPIAINKAELVINVDPGSGDRYASHPTLALIAIDSTGDATVIPDQSRSSSLFGGSLNNGQYRFNIAQYVQQILYGKRTDYGLYLRASAATATQTPDRTVVVGSSANSPLKMKLQITYTKLNP